MIRAGKNIQKNLRKPGTKIIRNLCVRSDHESRDLKKNIIYSCQSAKGHQTVMKMI